jgi:hypothetical protein
MKKLSEAQIRQVVREELINFLLLEAIAEAGEITNNELVNFFIKEAKAKAVKQGMKESQFSQFVTDVPRDFIATVQTNKTEQAKTKVMCSTFKGTHGGPSCHINYKGSDMLSLPEGFLKQLMQQGRIDLSNLPPPNPKTSYDKPLDTSGTIAGLPRNLRSLYGLEEAIRRLISKQTRKR